MFGARQFGLFTISIALGLWLGQYLLPKASPYLDRAFARLGAWMKKRIDTRRSRQEYREEIQRLIRKRS